MQQRRTGRGPLCDGDVAACEHRVDKPAERLGRNRVGERQARELLEIPGCDIRVGVYLLDSRSDIAQRLCRADRTAQGCLQGLDFGRVGHAGHFTSSTGLRGPLQFGHAVAARRPSGEPEQPTGDYYAPDLRRTAGGAQVAET